MTGQPEEKAKDDASMSDQTYSAAQLRMARRKARRMGLNPANGRQAIELLEERGITIDDSDPTLTDHATATAPSGTAPPPPGKTPIGQAATSQATALMKNTKEENLPASQVLNTNAPAIITNEQRQLEIAKLEKKIRKRRDTKIRKMIRRFSLFVVLPTLIFASYYYFIATPLYASNAEFRVEAASAASTGGISSLLKGTPFASQSEAIAVQGYLQSRDAFTRLQDSYPFVELFEGDKVDPFRRISPDASEEEKYKLYQRQIKISYDNTDQVLRLEVRTPDPQSAEDIGNKLLDFAEERVDDQTQRLRDTGVADAQQLLEEKAVELENAQQEIFRIQEVQGTLSPEADKEVLVGQVAELKAQLTQKEIALNQILQNSSPNQIRVRGLQSDIKLLEETIASLNEEGNNIGEDGQSISRLAQQMTLAQTKLALANQEYESASLNLQAAQAEARSQRRFVVPSLPPTATFEPIYPKKFTSTISIFIIFFAVYILVSLTVEVIREQVSA